MSGFACLGRSCPGCSTCDPLRPTPIAPHAFTGDDRRAPCTTCRDPFETHDEATLVECAECNGTGADDARAWDDQPCRACKGARMVPA